MTNLDHLTTLKRHGAQLRNPDDGTLIPLTEDFYHRAVEACRTGGYNAATYELVLPDVAGCGQRALAGYLERRPHRLGRPAEHLRLPRPLSRTRRLPGAFGPLLGCSPFVERARYSASQGALWYHLFARSGGWPLRSCVDFPYNKCYNSGISNVIRKFDYAESNS